MQQLIKNAIKASIEVRDTFLSEAANLADIERAVQVISKGFRNDGALYLVGNGGSAADAQHLAAEFVGRFYYDRPPLRAEALSTNTSDLTCIGNDYGFEQIFSRAVQGKGRKGDVLVAISTSGNSPNVVNAAIAAREKGMSIISMTGASGGRLLELSDVTIRVPSKDIPRIQECHITIGHIICELVEADLFPKK